jgi:hypothetical protein
VFSFIGDWRLWWDILTGREQIAGGGDKDRPK